MKYRAVFRNFNGTRNTEVEDLTEYILPIVIDGVIIETDGFEVLSIDKPEQYSQNQLAQFDYDKEYDLLVLKNYQLKTFIPIRIWNIQSRKRIETEIQITMTHNGKSVKRVCSLFGKVSEKFDLEVAFGEIQGQLTNSHCLETCSNCKNSFWNPYGGGEFYHLCFKSEAEAFQTIENKDKMTIIRFMKFDNDKNFKHVRLTDFCDDFEAR